MSFLTNPRRDASATIAGFVFQVNVTILRWLELRDDEHLELECGEDIDTVQDGSYGGSSAEVRLLEQIKARSARSVTLRSEEALEALSNFCSHRVANPTSKLKFRYITTANSGVEQGWYRPESGIETWSGLRRGRYDDAARHDAIQALRTFLNSCVRPQKVSVDSWQALQQVLASEDDSQLAEVIVAFEWGAGYGDYAQIENDIVTSLTRDGQVMAVDEKKNVYEHLFVFVFRLLCQPGTKSLTTSQLRTELRTTTPADLGILQLVRNELGEMSMRLASVEATVAHQEHDFVALKQTVGLIGKSLGYDSAFALSAVSLSTDVPDLVSPRTTRDALIDGLLSRLRTDGMVALVAEPGSGKTQLLVLAVGKTGRRTHWLNMPRPVTEAQACILLEAMVRSVGGQLQNTSFRESCDVAAEQFRNTLVVIEDLPLMIPGGPLATRLAILAGYLRSVDAHLFTSSYFRFPATAEEVLGKVHFEVPRFTTTDIAEILIAADAPQPLRAENVCQLLAGVTEGLPVLVMAAVRYLANRNWNFSATELESLLRGEFALAHRRDARSLLQVTVPDAGERELLIRMSLAIGTFTMKDIASVARIPNAIPLPGEKVQRATGLWLQQVGADRYLRSPLITSDLADVLDPEMRQGVHFVLALRILARKTLQPIEAFTCVNHLMLAGDVAFAVTVVLQTLAAFLELNEPVEDDFSFSRMWPSRQALAGVDVNLQVSLRAIQVAVLAKRGQDIEPVVETLDALIADIGARGWGVAVASSGLAIHLVWRDPILANKFLLVALGSYESARLPDGSALPPVAYPLEHILWVSAFHCKSDADVDSWLATVSRYTPAQMETLKRSDLMEDNITILCDGIWMRVYRKPEAERNWGPVKEKLEHVEATARAIGFPLLEAAAIRTRVMVLAEWDKRLDDALALSESSLNHFEADDCRFLVMEVTGRQLSYADRPQEAMQWLERALNCDAFRHSLWRRNVLITMAELHSASDPRKATEFTAEAVRISQDGKLVDAIYIETLAEHGMALWRAGEGRESFHTFEEAANRLFAIQTDANSWKGLFGRVFAVIAYFSAVALNGKPPDGQNEPEQGLFLASNEQAHTGYRIEQLAYICIRLAMFADGINDISKSAAWTWRAIEFANQIPTAWNGVRLATWHAIPAALMSDDFVRTAQIIDFAMATDVDNIVAGTNNEAARDLSQKASEINALGASVPSAARKSLLLVTSMVPVAIRLAYLQFRGATTAAIAASLAAVESVIPSDVQLENFVGEIRKALIDETDWQVLWNDGCRAFEAHEYVRGCVLSIGAMKKAPVSQSLYLQITIAQNFDGFFKPCQSIYREIVAPFFAAYWEQVVSESAGMFRTALAYTERRLQDADGTPAGTRRLLSAMRFCLGVKLPERAMNWLDSPE